MNGQTTIYFYDLRGRQIKTYQLSTGYPSNLMHTFAGQRLGQRTDRVGSKRADSGSTSHYYPLMVRKSPAQQTTLTNSRRPTETPIAG